ncbi:MAG: Crp/Fnr family transcriptional regulator [Phormidesmis sp.]
MSQPHSQAVRHTRQNQLLAHLSEATYQRLKPHLQRQIFPLEKVLYHPQEPITIIYFPVTALLSWISLIENGTLTEIALVGNEGMVGLPAIWGGGSTPNSVIVQGAGEVISIEAQVLKEEFRRGGDLSKELFLYMQAVFTQIAQNAMCNRQHTTEERLARWLLSVQDSVHQDELSLTHDFMARMLGIRRSSVTVSAGILQQAGMIRYARGQLSILDRPKLEETACECYRVVQSEYHRLLHSRTQSVK